MVRAMVLVGVGWGARALNYIFGFHFHQVGPVALNEQALQFQFVLNLLGDAPTVLATYLGVLAIRGQRRSLLGLAASLIGVDVIWGILSGSRFMMVVPLASLAIAYSRAVRPVRLGRALLALLAFTVVVFPTTTAIRTGIYQNRVDIVREGFSTTTLSRSLESAARDDLPGTESASALELLGDRLHGLTSFALVIRHTPERHPYRLGETFVMTPLMIAVPRAIWPDKPVPGAFTKIFKHLYWGLETDDSTSVAPSQLGAFWSHFGFVGVLIGMWLSGATFALVTRHVRFGTGTRSVYPIAVSSSLMLTLMQTFETEFETNIEGLPKILLVFFLIAWGLSGRRPASLPAPLTSPPR